LKYEERSFTFPDIRRFLVTDIRQFKSDIRPDTGYKKRPDYPSCNAGIGLAGFSVHPYFWDLWVVAIHKANEFYFKKCQ
jgi:hypothetical protein